MTAVGEALKTEGQEQSTQGVDDYALAAFVTVIEGVRVGDPSAHAATVRVYERTGGASW